MNINLSEILNMLGTLLAGGGAGWLLKSGRRTAEARAEKSEVEARQAEFDLLRQQISLNQQQNVDLIEQLGRKEERFAEQTERLRGVQAELQGLTERLTVMTARIGRLERARDYLRMWHCRQGACDRRQPPCPALAGAEFDAALAMAGDSRRAGEVPDGV